MQKLIWIIDDEWPDYEMEKAVFAEKLDDYTVCYSRPEDLQKDLEAFGKNADAVICQISVKMTKQVIDKLDRCKIISNYGTGYNNINLEAARGKGIAVGYIPGYCAEDIADYVAAALYYSNRPVDGFYSQMQEGLWGAQTMNSPVHRISSQILFVIGLGQIGSTVAKKAQALGVRVLAYSPSLTEEKAKQLGVEKVTLNEGLETADFVSVHLKYCAATEKYLNYSHFCQMKKTAYLINTARGSVLDQEGLVKAVREGTIAGAVLDVLQKEPPEKSDPVLNTKNIIVTPHISYYSVEALQQLQYRAAKNAVLTLLGQEGADLVPNK